MYLDSKDSKTGNWVDHLWCSTHLRDEKTASSSGILANYPNLVILHLLRWTTCDPGNQVLCPAFLFLRR